jgi:hypothetical protein
MNNQEMSATARAAEGLATTLVFEPQNLPLMGLEGAHTLQEGWGYFQRNAQNIDGESGGQQGEIFGSSERKMNSTSLGIAVIQLLTMILISYMVFAEVRYMLRRRASKNWPTTAATIDNGIVGFQGPLSGLPRILYRVHFSYSYCVGELKHNGRFFLLVNSKNAGEELRRELLGRNVLVKYDDRKPGVALLIDQELLGKRVMQGPSWSYR